VVVDLIDKMQIVVDPSLENRSIMLRGAQLEIKMKSGEVLSAYIEVPKGEKRVPVGPEDVQRKLDACAGTFLSERQRETVFDACMRLDQVVDLREFFLLLANKE